VHESRIGGQAVALRELHDIPGDEPRCRQLADRAVASHARGGRQELAKRLGGALGLDLLREGEYRVQHDHRDDRHRERRNAAYEGEHRGGPQQQRERVGELARELAPAAGTLAPRYLVRAVLDEPPRRLAALQAAEARAQVTQE
jgi:hypothetical protein